MDESPAKGTRELSPKETEKVQGDMDELKELSLGEAKAIIGASRAWHVGPPSVTIAFPDVCRR